MTSDLTIFITVKMYVVTFSLPCFSNIFLSATTRVSTFRLPFFWILADDLLNLAEVPYSSERMYVSSVGGLGASKKEIKLSLGKDSDHPWSVSSDMEVTQV